MDQLLGAVILIMVLIGLFGGTVTAALYVSGKMRKYTQKQLTKKSLDRKNQQ